MFAKPCLRPGLPPGKVADSYRYWAGGHDAQEVLFTNKHGLAAVLLFALLKLFAILGARAFLAAVKILALGL